jgi:hypothetical protein
MEYPSLENVIVCLKGVKDNSSKFPYNMYLTLKRSENFKPKVKIYKETLKGLVDVGRKGLSNIKDYEVISFYGPGLRDLLNDAIGSSFNQKDLLKKLYEKSIQTVNKEDNMKK